MSLSLPALNPQAHAARLLHEDLPSAATFRGSILLDGGGAELAVVALVQKDGLLAAVPVERAVE